MPNNNHLITADHFCRLLVVNVDNQNMSDEVFRTFVRNTLTIVDSEKPAERPDWSHLNSKLPTEPIDVIVCSRVEDKNTSGFLVHPRHIKSRKPIGAKGKFHGIVPGAGGDLWWVEHEDGSVAAYCYLTELEPV